MKLLAPLLLPLLLAVEPAAAFPIKAFHLDLRIQVMTLPALERLVQQLHDGGVNTLIMEYEGTYPFEHHAPIPNRYAYTKEEITQFVAYCDRLDVAVIPLQQSFGHVEYILRHDRYKGLREDDKDLSQICPSKPAEDSLLFTDLYAQLAKTHPGPYIHIGCDETHLLGHCALCRKRVAEEGISALYFNYVRMLCNIVIRLGKRPVLWADMALKYPEAIRTLPKGTIFVDWNYGWNMNNFGEHRKLVESGYEIWGAPSIRSNPDNFYLTDWKKHFHNISDFVSKSRELGYAGIVLTSWSTSGAYSYLYESENELLDLQAIRHVYPLTGFHILLAAYFQSLRDTLDVDRFIAGYCADRFGFSPVDAATFRQALFDTTSLAMKTLHPSKNQTEFKHFCLMADIRRQYQQFEAIQREANSENADPQRLVPRLKALLDADSTLSRAFIELNQDDYYPSELTKENALRTEKIRILYDQLSKSR